MEENQVVKALGALAQPLRLQVFRALVVVGDAGLTPGAMQEALGVPPATLSFHLKELVHAGLVTQERASRNLIYRAAYGQMNALLAYLTDNCCQGAPCAATKAPRLLLSLTACPGTDAVNPAGARPSTAATSATTGRASPRAG
jgi:DNA-binding transcriptional ArsR family regulator